MPLSPEQLAQYNQSFNQYLNDPSSLGGAGMTTPVANPNAVSPNDPAYAARPTGVTDFFNDPNYQLIFGANQEMDPAKRFEADPGLQKAIEMGSQKLMGQFAAQGLGGSGALGQGLTDYMYKNYTDFQNAQNQAYNTFYNRQQQQATDQYGRDLGMYDRNINEHQDYLNRLAGLSSMGSQQSGANDLMSNAGQLANIISQMYGQQGSLGSQGILGTGNNLSQILSNLGAFNAGSILNNAAAQNQNLFSGNALSMQLANNMAQGNAGTMNSMFGGMGAQAGMNQLQGGGRLF